MTIEIIYPVFLKCIPFTDDKYWKNIFENFSYGKCVQGMYFNKSYLCYKDFRYKIEDTVDPVTLYKTVRSLLVKKMGILSDKDKALMNNEFARNQGKIMENNTDMSNIKTLKTFHVNKFVLFNKKLHDLSLKQCQYLKSSIFMLYKIKKISIKDIDFNDQMIQSIKGVTISNRKVEVDYDMYSVLNKRQKVVVKKKTSMHIHWKTYVDKLIVNYKNLLDVGGNE
jgi:hypothetical protein